MHSVEQSTIQPILSSLLWGQKFPSICALEDEKWIQIHRELADYPYALVNNTPYISDFYNSSIEAFIRKHKIDTVLLTGATTSGSIRATAVDAIQRGIRVVILREAVGDRNQSLQATALTDLHARYGDVMSVSRVLQNLELLV